ncbi:MAG TPA: SDR family NAD(P)-dependent oxidoreductase, partial [Gemmatimonadales bacterium]|nr:SDR family NAD(P)-dependent oxidoreductase [Gemmatimonadales bacterium]
QPRLALRRERGDGEARLHGHRHARPGRAEAQGRTAHVAGARRGADPRGGTIVAVSSIAGERGRRTFPAYSTSKAGLTAWMEALRNRVARHGVNIVTAKPGYVDTSLLDQLERRPKGLLLTPAPRAAKAILDAAHRGGSPTVFVPGFIWPLAMILRHMPSLVFRRLNI